MFKYYIQQLRKNIKFERFLGDTETALEMQVPIVCSISVLSFFVSTKNK